MKIGLFYQSGHRLEACYFALKQFRKFYPDAPIALYEDNTSMLQPVAKKFNCVYNITKIKGRNHPYGGLTVFDVETAISWLEIVYESCTTTLKNVDWVMHFEDDVWIRKPIVGEPPFDLSSPDATGAWEDEVYKYLNVDPTIYNHGCGGSIFNRLKFIEAYENIKNIDWWYIDSLTRKSGVGPTRFQDSLLTYVFLYSKFTIGLWSELKNYSNHAIGIHDYHVHSGNDRIHITAASRELGWPGTIKELEAAQGDASVIHIWKRYYYPTEEETEFIKEDLEKYE